MVTWASLSARGDRAGLGSEMLRLLRPIPLRLPPVLLPITGNMGASDSGDDRDMLTPDLK